MTKYLTATWKIVDEDGPNPPGSIGQRAAEHLVKGGTFEDNTYRIKFYPSEFKIESEYYLDQANEYDLEKRVKLSDLQVRLAKNTQWLEENVDNGNTPIITKV